MAVRPGRIDRGEAPTFSRNHPDEARLYDGRIRQNLYGKGQKVPSRLYKERYDEIRWND